MDDDEFQEKLAELGERIGDSPDTFSLTTDERERVERYIGDVILTLQSRDFDSLNDEEPMLGTPETNLTPAEWELLAVLIDELPPADFPEG